MIQMKYIQIDINTYIHDRSSKIFFVVFLIFIIYSLSLIDTNKQMLYCQSRGPQ
jgi:hypothetical protein